MASTTSPRGRAGSQGQGVSGFRNMLRSIPDLVEELGPIEFVFPTEPPEHVRRLLATLGVAVAVDADDRLAPRVRRAA